MFYVFISLHLFLLVPISSSQFGPSGMKSPLTGLLIFLKGS